MELIACFETSVTNYKPTPRNISHSEGPDENNPFGGDGCSVGYDIPCILCNPKGNFRFSRASQIALL
jgi:hypothetical protein